MGIFYPVKVTVIDKKGTCDAGHNIGDSWTIDMHTPSCLCCEAYCALWSTINVFRMGGSHPWDKIAGAVTSVVCPDQENSVTFEVRRLKKKTGGE